MANKNLPKVDCKLSGRDGNAFFIMGRFQGAAKKAGWSQEDIDALMEEAMSSNYDHLLHTIMQHCENP